MRLIKQCNIVIFIDPSSCFIASICVHNLKAKQRKIDLTAQKYEKNVFNLIMAPNKTYNNSFVKS